MKPLRVAEGEGLGFSDSFLSGYTVKILDATGRKSRAELASIADAALFNYAYGQSQVLVPARSWDPLSRLLRHRRRETVQFPRRIYNGDLVAYYQLAMSSESALLSYLSLYNILEYFFSAATEQVLHAKLAELLVLPDFSHTKAKKLRDLAKTVRAHDQKVKEELALRLVIENKFDLSEVEAWIRGYEAAEGIWFTDKKPLFGEAVPISLSPDQLASSLSKRIYHLRCLLVHNKEAESSRYLPFSQDDDDIRRDLPLMVFLAEKLIVASGKDL